MVPDDLPRTMARVLAQRPGRLARADRVAQAAWLAALGMPIGLIGAILSAVLGSTLWPPLTSAAQGFVWLAGLCFLSLWWFALIQSLLTGVTRVNDNWPVFIRKDNPIGYWFAVLLFGFVSAAGVWLAVSLARDLYWR